MSDDESRTTLQPQESTDRKETTQPEPQRRSQSPPRRPKRKDAGFRWKEKRRDDDDQSLGRTDPYKSRGRSRSRSRSPRRRDDRYDRDDRRHGSRNDRHASSRKDERDDRRQHSRDDNQIHSSRDERRERSDRPRDDRDDDRRDRGRSERKLDRGDKEKKPAAKPVQAQPQQEMILVTVNDRLGTKKQIPCLPTDTVKDFKAVVAMMIGRRPREILLKRQSERPFKDFLTLQDYGVSNNVQLDLEVDTGD